MLLGVVFAVLLVIIFGYGVYEARTYPFLAHVFPYWISLVALVLSVAQLMNEIRRYFLRVELVEADFVDLAPDRSMPPEVIYRRALKYLAWILGLYLAIWVVGFVIAMTLFLLIFLRCEARLRWSNTLTLTVCGALFLIGISWIMTLFWPEGLIAQWVDLPWLLA